MHLAAPGCRRTMTCVVRAAATTVYCDVRGDLSHRADRTATGELRTVRVEACPGARDIEVAGDRVCLVAGHGGAGNTCVSFVLRHQLDRSCDGVTCAHRYVLRQIIVAQQIGRRV